MTDPVELLARAGGPRPLPAGLRRRLETALIGGAPAEPSPEPDVEALLSGLGVPRPLPPRVRAHLFGALARRPRWDPGLVRRIVAVAAAVAMLASSGVAVVRLRGATGRGPAVAIPTPPAREPVPPPATAAPTAPGQSSAGIPSPTAPVAGTGAIVVEGRGDPPPFFLESAIALLPALRGETTVIPPKPKPPIQIGIVPGDPRVEAGFRAYLALLNEQGGVRGHRLEVVRTSPSAPAVTTAGTVNLSGSQIAAPQGPPSWTRAPLLEDLAVDERVLTGGVFDLASAPERQGHLIAERFAADGSPPGIVALYEEPDGLLGGRVPDEIARAFEAKGSTVLRIEYREEDPQPLLVPADLAVLSLETGAAGAWLRDAAALGHRPTEGVAGIYSLHEESLLPDLPDGTTVLSPYQGQFAELAALQKGLGTAKAGAAAFHGWVTAKALAVAIWETGAETATGMRRALEGLTGFRSGFFDPYRVRSGTHSRTPEAVVFKVRGGKFVTRSGFQTDPF